MWLQMRSRSSPAPPIRHRVAGHKAISPEEERAQPVGPEAQAQAQARPGPQGLAPVWPRLAAPGLEPGLPPWPAAQLSPPWPAEPPVWPEPSSLPGSRRPAPNPTWL